MKRLKVLIAMMCLGVAGCAHWIPVDTVAYPFRAEFVLQGHCGDREINAAGALVVIDADHMVAQIYGPFGIAQGTANFADGELVVYDTWGRAAGGVAVPLKGLPGLLSGCLPAGGIRCCDAIRYSWGRVQLSASGYPVRLSSSQGGWQVKLENDDHDLRLDVCGRDCRLSGKIVPLEGGRWGL